jgi:hypothetical protein
MQRFAFSYLRRIVPALVMCLLAMLFALEAKAAWYGPPNGPGIDISSQKALPADSPAIVSRSSAPHSQSQFPFELLLFAVVGALLYSGAIPSNRADLHLGPVLISSAFYFSPALFFRPPPAL